MVGLLSAAADEGDEFDVVAVGELVLGVALLGDDGLVDLDGAGLVREIEGLDELLDGAAVGEGSGLAVEIDLHGGSVGGRAGCGLRGAGEKGLELEA